MHRLLETIQICTESDKRETNLSVIRSSRSFRLLTLYSYRETQSLQLRLSLLRTSSYGTQFSTWLFLFSSRAVPNITRRHTEGRRENDARRGVGETARSGGRVTWWRDERVMRVSADRLRAHARRKRNKSAGSNCDVINSRA